MERHDSSGTWTYLGTVTPVLYKWVKFPVVSTKYNDTFRITFGIGTAYKLSSIAWMRCGYFTHNTRGIGTREVVEPSFRVYPKPQSVIIKFPYPKDFSNKSTFLTRYFEIQKILLAPTWKSARYDYNWNIRLEELTA